MGPLVRTLAPIGRARRSARQRAASALGLLLLASACARSPHPLLHSTTWVRSSAEYDAVAREAWRLAIERLDEALAHSFWTAALEQTGDYQELPPAVIVDVDETVLDNSPFQTRLIRAGEEFDPELWNQWVLEAAAPPVPGALEFARAAQRRGVTIFYVTNRDKAVEAATRRNLEAAGFPVDPGQDQVLTRGERRDWISDKSSRREVVARRYRILLLVGDDFNDFVSARLSPAQRATLAARYADRWGRQWIMLPNPMYGSWEDALYGYQSGLSADEKTRRKAAALD